MTWWHDGETEWCAPAAGRQEVYETDHVFFLSLISILFTVLWLNIRTMFLKPFYHIFGSCSPAKGMVYELSETDRVAMVCSVLQPCVAAMRILIEQDQHHWAIPDFCHLCQFSGMNRQNATDFSMYFGLEQYEVLNVNHIKGHSMAQGSLFKSRFAIFKVFRYA